MLLVDTNRAAVPIYKYLKSQGFDITVVGGDQNETLAKMAEHYVALDYSDIPAMTKLVSDQQYDYLIPGCTDLSYLVCSKIGYERFSALDHIDNVNIINSKNRFRELCNQLHVPTPKVLNVGQDLKNKSVIIKPVDSFSGRGVTVLKNPNIQDFQKAFQTACEFSKSKNAVVEEFIEGQLYSYSAFVQKKKVVADFFVQEGSSTNPFAVDTSRVVHDMHNTLHDCLKENVENIVSELNLVDGLMHVQFIENDGEYWIIEMTRRCPGDIYSLLVEFSTQYAYAANYVAPFIGAPIEAKKTTRVKKQIVRHTITSKDGEEFWGLQFSQHVTLKLFVPLATSGDYISPSPYGRVGIAFFELKSEIESNLLYNSLIDRSLYVLEYQN